jgi:hypothetical protein
MGCHGGLPFEKEYASKIRLNADEVSGIERSSFSFEPGYSLRKPPSISAKGGIMLWVAARWICAAVRREALPTT